MSTAVGGVSSTCEKIPSLENQNYQETKQAVIGAGVNPNKIEIILLEGMPLVLA